MLPVPWYTAASVQLSTRYLGAPNRSVRDAVHVGRASAARNPRSARHGLDAVPVEQLIQPPLAYTERPECSRPRFLPKRTEIRPSTVTICIFWSVFPPSEQPSRYRTDGR